MKLTNVENALKYISEHQFDLDPEMRRAVFTIMEDREKLRRWMMEKLIPDLEKTVGRLEEINERMGNHA